MPTSEERLKIMKMVQEGKISAEEAIQLLDAFDPETRTPPKPAAPPRPGGTGRWFRVRITDTTTGKVRANIRLPLSLVSAGLKMGAKFSPDLDGMDMNLINDALRDGQTGLIVDVIDHSDSEHVEVFIEG